MSTSVSPAAVTAAILPLLPTLKEKLDLRALFIEVTEDLKQIEECIRKQAYEFDPGIVGYVSYALESHGKRIRPALGLLTARAIGIYRPGHVELGTIVELIHLATLVHDDIMDEASRRRGQPTAFAKWGAEISVLLGDCLFCHALKLCSKFENPDVSRKIADAANEVCTGEILQTQRRFDFKLSIPDYLKIIGMKTAALFRVATELAAVVSECTPEVVASLRAYGENLGIAYQIYDDCLDFVGTEEAIGKTLGSDLVKGKLTLPILHFLGECGPEERAEWQEVILHGTEADRLQLLGQVVSRGSLRHAIDCIQGYLQAAEESLLVLPKSTYRSSMQGIANALMKHIQQMG